MMQLFPKKTYSVFAVLIVIIGIILLAQKAIFLEGDSVDFKYLWVAGEIWASGASPYSEVFNEFGKTYFPNTNQLHAYFYPPNSWGLTLLLSTMTYSTADYFWSVFSGLCILAGWFILYSASDEWVKNKADRILIYSICFCYTCLMWSTPIALAIGQTSPLMFLALCVSFYGYVKNCFWCLVVGLCILMLKPNLGLVISIFYIFTRNVKATFIAALIVIGMSLPPFILAGFLDTVYLYLERLSEYGTFPTNYANATTGVRTLLYMLFGVQFSAFYTLVVAIVFMGVVVFFFRKLDISHKKEKEFISVVLITAFSLSFHSYDLIIVSMIFVLSLQFRGWMLISLLPCWLLFIRPNVIATKFSFLASPASHSPESYIVSTVLLVMLSILVAALLKTLCTKQVSNI